MFKFTRSSTKQLAPVSTEFTIADMTVRRLGFGAMRITGPGVWGPPADHDEAIRVLRRAIELGINFIDTADSYGPYVSEELIREALHPYPDDLVVATKAGLVRTGPGGWHPMGRPEYLRQECEMSLRRLGQDQLDLFQLHRIDPKVPAEEQFGLLKALVDEGKVRAVGLSNVSVSEIKAARAVVPIATVQNLFNLADRSSEKEFEYCAAEGIGFIPYFPVATGDLSKVGRPLDAVVAETGATPAQVALAWLLAISPVVLPIPGTSSVQHLEENCVAANLRLSAAQIKSLDRAVKGH